ncbi:hypothetical protein EDF38_1314 [Frigoribacterium sp. PhB160]|uniref:hypothetical protein n=1 Tax=Frigoribacterium sp. PhB160 TaxID=2485192 RepID=UPI000F461826|nr:hypothetical protein [Frigoribacterium sp. PhB160]ROS62211.1 hypothetical protein EDF38_1314 [Frigoribacterium sp. PhB160]
MTTDVEQLESLLGDKSRVGMYAGAFVSYEDKAATVDLEGSRLLGIKSATPYLPAVGEQVWVQFIDGVPWLLGPTVIPPGDGTIVTVSSESAVVETDIGRITATYTAGQALSSGQNVKLYWQGGPHVIGPLATTPPPKPTPDPPAPSPSSRHVDVFTAVDAGSWSGAYGWRQAQVWASDSLLGAWFYGSKIRDTLADAAVEKIEIWSTLTQIRGNPPVFATHPHAGKPTGAPALSSSTATPVASGRWVQLPLSFGQFLASNVGGIGLNHGGYNKFRSLAEDPQSGALRITSIY